MKKSSPGFSLLELIVALALFAIAVMSILQLLPAALKLHHDTQSAINATAIAQTIFSMLQVSAPNGILTTSSDGFINPNHSVSFSLKQNSTHDIGYDSTGQAVRLLTEEEATESLREKAITSIAHIIVTSDEAFQNIARVEVTISGTARQPERLRHHFIFCALLSTLAHDEK